MGNFVQLDDIKQELNMKTEDSQFDDLISSLIDAIESLLDELTDRVFFQTTHVEYHSTDKLCGELFLHNWPVSSIASLYDDPDWVYGSSDLIAADDYTFDPESGIVYYNGYFFEGKRNVKATYVAGYTATSFPKGHKRILIRQICEWYDQAKNKRWSVVSDTQPGGGSQVKSFLVNNFLPDFLLLIERETRNAI